jgi:hypothetical protein
MNDVVKVPIKFIMSSWKKEKEIEVAVHIINANNDRQCQKAPQSSVIRPWGDGEAI